MSKLTKTEALQLAKATRTAPDKLCDGCGKSVMRGEGSHRRADGVTVEIAPGCTVTVCRSRRYTRAGVWVEGCLIKAKAKKLVCPGCGGEWRRVIGVCKDCKATIEKAKLNKTPMEEIFIRQEDFFYWLTREHTEFEYGTDLQYRLGKALVKVLLGPGTRDCGFGSSHGVRIVPHTPNQGWDRVTSGNPHVEVAKSQADGLEELAALLKEIFDRQRLEGRKEGKSLLLSLAEGRVSVDDFNAKDKKLEEEL